MQGTDYLEMESKRVLVVDDEPILRQMLLKIINRTNHLGFEAENGKAALELYEQEPFDLVILDLRMPVMGGRDFLAALAERDWKPSVIMLTGHGELQEANELLRLYKIHDFIQKPLQSPFQLIFGIHNALDKRQGEAELKASNRQLQVEIELRKQAEEQLARKNKQITDLLRESNQLNGFVHQQNEHLKNHRRLLLAQKEEILGERTRLAQEIDRATDQIHKFRETYQLKKDLLRLLATITTQTLLSTNTLKSDRHEDLKRLLQRVQWVCDLESCEAGAVSQLVPTEALLTETLDILQPLLKIGQTELHLQNANLLPDRVDFALDIWRFLLQALVDICFAFPHQQELDVSLQVMNVASMTLQISFMAEEFSVQQDGAFSDDPIISMVWLLANQMAAQSDSRLHIKAARERIYLSLQIPLAEVAVETKPGDKTEDVAPIQPVAESRIILLFDTDILRAFELAQRLQLFDFEVHIADRFELVANALKSITNPSLLLFAARGTQAEADALQTELMELTANRIHVVRLIDSVDDSASQGSHAWLDASQNPEVLADAIQTCIAEGLTQLEASSC